MTPMRESRTVCDYGSASGETFGVDGQEHQRSLCASGFMEDVNLLPI